MCVPIIIHIAKAAATPSLLLLQRRMAVMMMAAAMAVTFLSPLMGESFIVLVPRNDITITGSTVDDRAARKIQPRLPSRSIRILNVLRAGRFRARGRVGVVVG